jgi:hypothetical protein
MPFAPSGLTPLVQTAAFSLWHYVTSDARATVAAAGYFAPVAERFKPGDIMFLQAADSMAMLPMRSGPLFGPGVTLDGAVAPISAIRTAAQNFSFTQAVGAIIRTIVLAPIAAGFLAGMSIPVSAQVQGPISQVVVSVRDSTGATLPGSQIVTVVGGFATAAVPAPPAGTGYRIRMEDVQDPAIADVTRTFSVLPANEGQPLRQENGFVILIEAGGRLLAE